MSDDFKAGDLAITPAGLLTFRTEAGWTYADGGTINAYPGHDGEWFRPLVVIDPENREQVERMARAHHKIARLLPWESLHESTRAHLISQVQAALREFANPTPSKPEEPKGHLAIVKDADGRRWVSMRDPREGAAFHDTPWMLTELDTDEFRNYVDIDVVEVVYEGVPA